MVTDWTGMSKKALSERKYPSFMMDSDLNSE